MKLLAQYFQIQQQIFDYFGYAENWRVIPLDDQTGIHCGNWHGNANRSIRSTASSADPPRSSSPTPEA